MEKNDFIKIGKIKKPHGLVGAVKVFIEEPFLDTVSAATHFFLHIKNQYLPYFIEECQLGNEVILKFEDLSSKEAAQSLRNVDVFIKSSDLPNEVGIRQDQSSFNGLIGFTINDVSLGTIGPIEDVLELPQQYLASITYQERECLIPLHDELIESIDEQAQTILMNLPEGLLNL